MDDPNILTGISKVVNPQNVKSDVNFAELEKNMLTGGLITKPSQDPEEAFNDELKKFAQDLNISFDDVNDSNMGKNGISESISDGSSSSSDSIFNSSLSSISNQPRPLQSSYASSFSSFGGGKDEEDDDDEDDDDEDDEDDEDDDGSYNASFNGSGLYSETSLGGSQPRSTGSSFGSSYNSSFSGSSPSFNSNGGGTTSNMYSTELQQRTHEQERQSHISSVIGNMRGSDATETFSIEKEKEEDTKSQLLEQIDMLRITLEDEGADLSRIPEVNEHSPLDEVHSIHKLLRLKNDRNRYCSFAEEFVMFGAHALEEIFDGKRVWFNRYSPDLTGWHNTVNVKLRRMRYDTSNLVSGVMQDYNIGSTTRIALELVPSMFLHSKMRRQQFGSQTLYSDDQMSSAMNNIRDIEDM